ncbi:MAG: hypothetical protein ACRD36_03955, partial [Candidatus Acidiferrum sp.]
MLVDQKPFIKPGQLPLARVDTVHGDADATAQRILSGAAFRFPEPLIMVPVRPDGAPDWDQRALGIAVDFTPKGELEIHWADAPELETTARVALLKMSGGLFQAVGIEIESTG